MTSAGDKYTDDELQELEDRIKAEYQEAYKTVAQRLDKFLEEFKEEDAEKKSQVESGELSEKEYLKWRKDSMLKGDAWKDLRDTLAADLSNANKIAVKMINDSTEDVYALNMNYGTYEIESGTGINTSFALYDHSTVENLFKEDPQVIPQARLDIPEDKRWNRKKITSAITQGILSGESILNIAKRLRSVTSMNQAASIRNARTYTTAAQNKGRVDSYQRAVGMGIDIQQEWMATPDLRTRSSHARMDGEHIKIGGKFSNGCRYPGDPKGAPEEIYNCRCTLVAFFPEDEDYRNDNRYTDLPDGMTYDEWKARHRVEDPAETKERKRLTDAIANAKDYDAKYNKANYCTKIYKSLNDEQKEAISEYTGGPYAWMNAGLRQDEKALRYAGSNDPDYRAQQVDKLRRDVKNLTDILDSISINEDQKFYRGMGKVSTLARMLGLGADELADAIQSKDVVGLTFEEKGFCSTSLKGVLGGFKNEINLEIVAPAGTKGMFIAPVSETKGEREFLLQQGTRFEIVDCETTKKGRDVFHKLTVVVTGQHPQNADEVKF